MLGLSLGMGGCTEALDDADLDKDALVVEDVGDGTVELELTDDGARGHYFHADAEVRFEAAIDEDTEEVTLELRGMMLLLTIDRETGAFDVDGFSADNGLDTQILPEDKQLIAAFDQALGALELEEGEGDPAVDLLVRAATLFGDYASSLPLQRAFYGRLDRSSNLCGSVNRPGQGVNTKRWTNATHDCNDTAGDCSNWWGCDRWDDNSTVDHVFMSMHPDGSCGSDTYFGDSSTGFSCQGPDHPGGKEYAYGGCFGRCGAGCGSGTQFTRACVDHDLCVRFGHSITSIWCNDEFAATGWDVINASHCSGAHFTVDYNWAGTSRENSCPTSWKDTNDGCDHGCQFIDGDCFR
ncbi:MAG: hypothetical protein AAF799_10755 [Myxococcota bacterium]